MCLFSRFFLCLCSCWARFALRPENVSNSPHVHHCRPLPLQSRCAYGRLGASPHRLHVPVTVPEIPSFSAGGWAEVLGFMLPCAAPLLTQTQAHFIKLYLWIHIVMIRKDTCLTVHPDYLERMRSEEGKFHFHILCCLNIFHLSLPTPTLQIGSHGNA